MEAKRVYRTFDNDFKVNAAKLVLEGTRSMNKIAEELGISASTLSNRKRDYLIDKENPFPGKGYQKLDDTEFTKLRKQLFRVTQERDILKKPAAAGCIHKTRGVTYDFIERNNREYSVGLICRMLDISKSAY